MQSTWVNNRKGRSWDQKITEGTKILAVILLLPLRPHLSLLMFFRAGVPIQTEDVVLEMFRTKNRLSWAGGWDSQEVLFGTVPQTPLL